MIALQSQAIKLNTAMEELGSPEVDAAGSMAVTTSAAIGDTGAAGAGAGNAGAAGAGAGAAVTEDDPNVAVTTRTTTEIYDGVTTITVEKTTTTKDCDAMPPMEEVVVTKDVKTRAADGMETDAPQEEVSRVTQATERCTGTGDGNGDGEDGNGDGEDGNGDGEDGNGDNETEKPTV